MKKNFGDMYACIQMSIGVLFLLTVLGDKTSSECQHIGTRCMIVKQSTRASFSLYRTNGAPRGAQLVVLKTKRRANYLTCEKYKNGAL